MSDQLSNNTTAALFVRHERLLLAAFVLMALYHVIGVFPLVPVYGDGIGMANGTTEIAASGLGPNSLTYRYSQHSGTYVLVVLLHHLTGLDTQSLFLIVSALCAAVFVLFSALLIREITGCPFSLAGIVVLLFQESYSGGYYTNSTVIAAAFAISALYLMRVSKTQYLQILGGALFGLSAWMRLDTVLIAPVVLLLLYNGNWPQAIYRTLVVGSVAAVVCVFAMAMSGATIQEILLAFSERSGYYSEEEELSNTLQSHVSYFSALSVFLMVVGVYFLLTKRRWYSLAIILIGILPLPFYVFVLEGLDNPRHIYYLVPFFSILVIHALWDIQFTSRRMKWSYISTIAILFIVQYPIGVKAYPINKLNEPLPRRVLFVTGISLSPGQNLALWLGPTQNIGHNGGRLSSGLLWAPWWHCQKKRKFKAALQELYSYLEGRNLKVIELYAKPWTDGQLLLQIPLQMGYAFQQRDDDEQTASARYVYRKQDRVAIVTIIKPKSFLDERNILAQIKTPGAVFVTRGGQLLSEADEWQQVAKLAYERVPSLK